MFPWEEYQSYRISPIEPGQLRHADVSHTVQSLLAIRPGGLQVARLGESVEGRSISLLTIGHGSQKVLAWSQMHGDEPTHSAAIVDLVHFLQRCPDHPSARLILAGCTLQMIVMLNPDGAERVTRRNAQGIDINRDALHLQSPEGRILRSAVEELRPDFALNLHDQRPRATVSDTRQVAALSLLVPPVDAEQTETSNVIVAKKLATCIALGVAEHCPGPVSRYNADFMPRCFGEWVQQQGVATVTIEAGGWSTIEVAPLVQLHFYGLLAGLEAIASGGLAEVEPNKYDALPPTGEHDSFDLVLRDVSLVNGLDQPPFRADVGINIDGTTVGVRSGKIVDLGDLCVADGKTLVEPDALWCLPGRIAWLPELTPGRLTDTQTLNDAAAQGLTTVVGAIDLLGEEEIAILETSRSGLSSPVNVGFLAQLARWDDKTRDRLLRVVSLGVLGVVAENLPSEAKQYLEWFRVPIIPVDDLATVSGQPGTLAQCARQTYRSAKRLGLPGRGAIQLGAVADLVLVKSAKEPDAAEALSRGNLQQVLVGGTVVFDRGKMADSAAGKLLTSR